MIKILLSKDKFLYDIHSLVKAFYQNEEVQAEIRDDIEETESRLISNGNSLIKRLSTDADGQEISIYRSDNNDITIMVRLPEEICEDDAVPHVNDAEAEETVAVNRINESTNGSDNSVITPKNVIKQALYRLLSEETGRELPWGALTGIRPTKIATQMIFNGKDDNTIKDYLKTVHYVSGEKADLSIEIAHREREILSRRDYENGYSLYVGIPFCPTRCSYCSFAAYPLRQAGHASATHPDRTEYLKTKYASMTDRYLACLEKELRATAEMMRGTRLDTVYIGGGTPTSLSVAQLNRLLKFLRQEFDFSAVQEFTVEAGRPDSILDDIGKLPLLLDYGADRICVNPQTFVQRTLDTIGRDHTTEQVNEAFHLARDAGFTNINMDIILGLPGEAQEDVALTMRQIAKLAPDDLTVHSLALKRGSRMHAALTESAGAAAPDAVVPPADAPMLMWKIAEEGAREMGLQPYYLYRQKNMTGNMENVGFARPGKEGLTNILGMEEVHSILACGAGAITKRVWNVPEGDPHFGLIRRAANVKELEAYLARVDEMIERKQALFSRTTPPLPASAI